MVLRTSAVLCAALLEIAAGCGGTQFSDGVYRDDELAFRIGPVPARWRQIEAEPARIAFRDDGNNATIALGGRCGKDGDDVPLQALTHHLFLHFTDRQVLSQEVRPLDGRDAL